jgi:hypothetical protein
MENTLFSFMSDHFASALEVATPTFSNCALSLQGPKEQLLTRSNRQVGYLEHDDRPTHNAHLYQASNIPASSHSDLNEFFTDSAIDPHIHYEHGEFLKSFGQLEPNHGRRSESLTNPDDSKSSVKISGLSDQCMNDPITSACRSPLDLWDSLSLDPVDMTWNVNTTVQHGQITPGNSPVSLGESTKITNSKTGRKSPGKSPRKMAVNRFQVSDALPCKSSRKPRKSRKSHKKARTIEEEAKHHEQFLKRNREAAHKCRIKRKSQIENIQDRAKVQANEIAAKGLEIARLKHEVNTLRALLMPHYQECDDQRMVEYLDAGTSRYEAWARDTSPLNFTALPMTLDHAPEESVRDHEHHDIIPSSPAEIDESEDNLHRNEICVKHDSPSDC